MYSIQDLKLSRFVNLLTFSNSARNLSMFPPTMLLIGIKWMLSIIISCDEECQARFTAKPETLVIFALQLCHLLFCVREKGRNIGFSVYLSVRVTRAECGLAKYFKFPVDLLLREWSRKEKHLYLGETTLSQPTLWNFSCEFHLFAK